MYHCEFDVTRIEFFLYAVTERDFFRLVNDELLRDLIYVSSEQHKDRQPAEDLVLAYCLDELAPRGKQILPRICFRSLERRRQDVGKSFDARPKSRRVRARGSETNY